MRLLILFFLVWWPISPLSLQKLRVSAFRSSSKHSTLDSASCQHASNSLSPTNATAAQNGTTFPTIVVMGDLHGDLESTLQLLKAAKLIDWNSLFRNPQNVAAFLRTTHSFSPVIDWVGNSTILVQMGDIVDRGPDGYLLYALFWHLGQKAEKAGGRVIQLFGNHEILNMCHVGTYVSSEEIKRHYRNDVLYWNQMWSANGPLGTWLRQDFSVVAHLFNRFLFVHAGLAPYAAEFAPEDLKAVLLHRVDKELCEYTPNNERVAKNDGNQVTTSDSNDSESLLASDQDVPLFSVKPPFDTSLLKAFRGERDILFGSSGPLWLRSFSLDPEVNVCDDVDAALAKAFSKSCKSENRKENDRKKCCGNATRPVRFMIVGHSVTPSNEIEFRCPVAQLNASHIAVEAHHLVSPSQYIMVDTGISREVGGQLNALRITSTDKNIAFHQISGNGTVQLRMLVPATAVINDKDCE